MFQNGQHLFILVEVQHGIELFGDEKLDPRIENLFWEQGATHKEALNLSGQGIGRLNLSKNRQIEFEQVDSGETC